MTSVFIRGKFGHRNIDTEWGESSEDRSKDWSGISASQGMPRIAINDQKLPEARKDCSLES